MKDKERFISRLEEELGDARQAETVYKIIEALLREEDAYRRECQKKGIERAKETGVSFGRPKIQGPENFDCICEQYICGEISAASGAELCKMGISTFYRRVRDYRDVKAVMRKDLI